MNVCLYRILQGLNKTSGFHINAQSASLRSSVAAESTLQQPMQPARDQPLFLCGFWMCIFIVDWNKKRSSIMGVWPWPLTIRGHLKSKIFSPFGSPYMTSYLLTSIDTLSVSHPFWDIWLQSFQSLTSTFRGHLGSKIFSPFESSYIISYTTSIETLSLSRTVFKIFDFNKFFMVWHIQMLQFLIFSWTIFNLRKTDHFFATSLTDRGIFIPQSYYL